nr:MAG: hypothetical protein BECKSD772F_GA0070984_102732 [Candidatus Kentron sp. SD]VFK43449.1 MAG: hypothetical protein BECKSD772E_GA0070983_102531 [Candidatus Kentron sp. SD]
MTVRSVVAKLLENRQKALVFSQFVDYLAIIRAVLDESGVVDQYSASSKADSPGDIPRKISVFWRARMRSTGIFRVRRSRRYANVPGGFSRMRDMSGWRGFRYPTCTI